MRVLDSNVLRRPPSNNDYLLHTQEYSFIRYSYLEVDSFNAQLCSHHLRRVTSYLAFLNDPKI